MHRHNQIGFTWPWDKSRMFYDLSIKWSALVKRSIDLTKKGALSEKTYDEVILNWEDFKRWYNLIDVSFVTVMFGDFVDELRDQTKRFNVLNKKVNEEAKKVEESTGIQPVTQTQFNTWVDDLKGLAQPAQNIGMTVLIGLIVIALIQSTKK